MKNIVYQLNGYLHALRRLAKYNSDFWAIHIKIESNIEQIIKVFLFVIISCSIIGCNNQLNSEEIEIIKNDCEKNIFHELTFTYGLEEINGNLFVSHVKNNKVSESFIIEPKNGNYIAKKIFFGNDVYILKMNNNRSFILTELKGKYNPRCHMFGCEPACGLESYKINGIGKKNHMTVDLEIQ